MTFTTNLFGDISDPQRVLRLVATADGWRVAWTPGDILAEFKDGGFLNIEQAMPNRGNIYDREGNAIADQNGVVIVTSLLTRAYPTGNPDDCYAELVRVFGKRTVEQFRTSYSRYTGQDYKFEVGRLSAERFNPERAALDRACTLAYESRPTRRYVAQGLAPHVVGFVGQIPAERADEFRAAGYPEDALVGLDGIEAFWEETLAGRGAARLLVYAGNNQLSRVLAERQPVQSQSVYLTLNVRLQEATQAALRSAFETAVWGIGAPGGAAVVMDVRTGAILAIASYPDFVVDAFNPNTSLPNAQELIQIWNQDPRRPTLNRATQGQFPAGSVFKIISSVAAADSGAFAFNTPLSCGGVWNGTSLGDRTRTDWLEGGHGRVTLKQALTASCNIYYWNIGWKLNGIDPYLLINYAKMFGIGQKTGIRDISEAAGSLPDPATKERTEGLRWTGSDALNVVIGQSLTVTPLQIVRAVAAVANGGTLYQPQLVERVGIIGKYSYEFAAIPQGRLSVKPEVLAGVREGMCGVTTNPTIGTAYFVYKDFTGAAVCGKTGTAQNRPGEADTAWFAAFAGKNADEPEIAIVVVIEKGGQGSYVASPIVRRIAETYFRLPISSWPVWYGDAAAFAPIPGETTRPLGD
jgi:penicillin-binding protein 2